MSEKTDPVAEVLRRLAAADDSPLAALAEALTLASEKETAATISAATDQLVSQGRSPAAIVDALVRIDEALFSSGATGSPVAAKWVAMAAERALHAEKAAWEEGIQMALANGAPIFELERSTLVAVPAGLIDEESIKRFSDRLLAEVMRVKPRRVLLVLNDRDQTNKKAALIFDALISDLNEQKMEVERVLFRPRSLQTRSRGRYTPMTHRMGREP